MFMNIIRLIMIFIFVTAILAMADEGMWIPHQISLLNLKDLGINLNPEDIYQSDNTGLLYSVVSLGGGTGAFVSAQGLIITNHHVAYGAIQRLSNVTNDYLKNGFLAQSLQEEIPATGTYVDILLGYQEVTRQIYEKINPAWSAKKRYEAIQNARKKLIAETEKKGPDIRAQIAEFYGGKNFYLYTFKRIKDVRLVYAPPIDLGNFGGEIDNWMWPRHTADFAFLRAYVSPDNLGKDYAPENVPFQPTHYLKISPDGIQPGDPMIVIGFPGRTFRYYTLNEFLWAKEQLEDRALKYTKTIDFYENASKQDREIEIKYSSRLRSLHNTVKNSEGKLSGFQKMEVEQRKALFEQDFQNWVDRDAQRQKMYGNVLKDIQSLTLEKKQNQTKMSHLTDWVHPTIGPALLYQAHLLYRILEEKQKSDHEREPEFQEREYSSLYNRIKLAEKGFDVNVDRTYFLYLLQNLQQEPTDQIPTVFRSLLNSTSNLQALVDSFYSHTHLHETAQRLQYFEGNLSRLLQSNDPLVKLAAEIEKELKIYRENDKILAQKDRDIKTTYFTALAEMKKSPLSPDANSTIRVSFGKVEGYFPRDGVFFLPQTTLKGVIEKDQGQFPFNVPERLKEIYQQKDWGNYYDTRLQAVPACFLTTVNVTGGNSGSPVLNSTGQLVGLVFDGTYESIVGDYLLIPEFQRSINVDIKYVLLVTEKFSGASRLIQELGL